MTLIKTLVLRSMVNVSLVKLPWRILRREVGCLQIKR